MVKKFFDEDEEMLWHKIISDKSSNERVYAVTNKRCYKKFHKIKTRDFSGAPKEYLKVTDDLLIIERTGIKVIKFSHWVSCILKGEDTRKKPYFVFDRVFRKEGEMLKNLLLDTSNMANDWGTDKSVYTPAIMQKGAEDWITPGLGFTDPGIGSDTAHIVESSNTSGKCTYCNIDLFEIQGKVFACDACGTFFHEACVNNVMREGYCLNCNKTLLW